MQYFIFLVSLLILPLATAQAETIVCESFGAGPIKAVTASRNPHDHEPQWFDVTLQKKGFFSEELRYSLSPLYFSGDKMDLMEFEGAPNKAKLLMHFSKVSGLHRASRKVEVILDKGGKNEVRQTLLCRSDRPVKFVDYCSVNKFGTPLETLFYASKVRNSNLVDMVMSCGIDNVNEFDKKGCSPLMYAVDHLCGTGERDQFRNFAGNNRILDVLISAGAFVDISDPVTGESPLLKSALDGDTYAFKAFADMEADIDSQDTNGMTALMNATQRGDSKLVELIIGYGPNLELLNNKGLTALGIAKEKGDKTIELLLEGPDKTLRFEGVNAEGCRLNETTLDLGKVTLIELQASQKKMFLLEIPELGVRLMSNPGQLVSTRIKPSKAGQFKFSCGVHGSNNTTVGTVTVR